MRKILKHIEWLAFAVCLVTLLIYLIYTLYIKLNSSVVVTDKLVRSLKAYLIIALISLFIGLLIILIKKIYYLTRNERVVTVKEEKVKVISKPKEEEKIIVNEQVKETKYVVKNNDYDDCECIECGNKISKKAAICPYCGILYDKAVLDVIKKYEKTEKRKARRFSLVGLITNIILIIIFAILSIILANKIYDKVQNNSYNTVLK